MQEYTILLPTRRNSDNAKHRPQLWQQFENSLSNTFGGFTLHGIVRGCWADASGRIVADKSRKYSVAIPDSAQAELFDIVRHYRPHFDQQCIYIALSSADAQLV